MLLKDKKGIVIGVANNKSIAYEIAKLLSENGAEIALTYQNEVLEKRITDISKEIGCNHQYKCDVTNPESLENLYQNIQTDFGNIDFIVHSIAFSKKEELSGRFIDTSLDNFLNTMNISCYSLVSLTKKLETLLSDKSSIVTLTYYGAQKVIPSYNVMGVAKAALETSVKYLAHDLGSRLIRVNAISAGPIRTLASSAISDFRSMINIHENTSPLKRNTTLKDVAKSSIYLLSDLSTGVTGEIHYVDCGYNIMGISGKK